MKPGIYPDLPGDDYHSGIGDSSTGIKKVLDCPLKYHYEYVKGNRKPPTDEMKFGTLFHTSVLESGKFSSSFMVSDLNRNSTKYKDLKAANPGIEVLKTHQANQIYGMFDAVMAHPAARLLLESDGATEQSYFWIDETTDLLCKSRPDKLATWVDEDGKKTKVIVDLKTAKSAQPKAYSKVMHDLGYHLSAAMYLEGAAENDDPREAFVHIVIEKEPPYIVEVYNIGQDTLDAGSEMFHAGLVRLLECKRSGVWPSYTRDLIQDVDLPYWAQ